jgi:hypothetical protein
MASSRHFTIASGVVFGAHDSFVRWKK